MTAISSTTSALFGSATQTTSLASTLFQGGSNSSASADDAATNVSISPEAKEKFERLEAERAFAEKLAQIVSSDSSAEEKMSELVGTTDAEGGNDLTIDDLVNSQNTADDNGKPLNRAANADQLDALLGRATEDLMVHAVTHRDPAAAQGLREAIANGTVRIRKAEDVPGVNLKTTITYFAGAGGTVGMSTENRTFNPTPEIQAEIDSGHAMTFWNINQGDLYITW